MIRYLILGLVLSISNLSYSHSKKSHRHHGSHVHGAGKLDFVFDQLQGKVSFKSAAESILGFEHAPKSEKELKVVAEAEATFKNEIAQMIQIPAELECVFTATQMGRVTGSDKAESQEDRKSHTHKHGEHSDFIANYDVICTKAIEGTKITFDFTRFKRLKDLDVTLVVGNIQKAAKLKQKPVTLEIK